MDLYKREEVLKRIKEKFKKECPYCYKIVVDWIEQKKKEEQPSVQQTITV